MVFSTKKARILLWLFSLKSLTKSLSKPLCWRHKTITLGKKNMPVKTRNAKSLGRDQSLYEKHLQEKVSMLQKVLKPYGIKVKAQAKPNAAKGILQNLQNQAESELKKPIKGEINQQQVVAFSEILEYLVYQDDNTGVWHQSLRHLAINAFTMSGKTGLISLCSFLPPIIYLLTGMHPVLVRLLINNCGLEFQSDRSSQMFGELYGDIEFSFSEIDADGKKNTHTTTLRDYIQDVMTKFPELEDFPMYGQTFRTTPSLVPEFQKMIDYISKNKENGLLGLAFCDEVHARCDKGGVMQRMLNDTSADKWISDGVVLLGSSATNHAYGKFCEQEGNPCINMKPGPNYTGFGWLMGTRCPVANIPKVMSFREFDDISGCVTDMDVKNLDYNTWDKEDFAQCKIWRRKWMQNFYKMVQFCLLTDNPAQGKGFLARIVVNNSTMKKVVDEMQEMYGSRIEFILYNQNTTKSIKNKKSD